MILTPVLWISTPAIAGSSFSMLSQSTQVIAVKNAKEMERIFKQIEQARAASQRVLSKSELEKIKDQAQKVLADQASKVIDSGATVFCGSWVVE